MNILAVNCGSSSIKSRLFDADKRVGKENLLRRAHKVP
jgi:acetate kinase